MKIYQLTQQQVKELLALNTTKATWAACYYEGYGVCIEEYTLENPDFYAHKELFQTFNITEYVIFEEAIEE